MKCIFIGREIGHNIPEWFVNSAKSYTPTEKIQYITISELLRERKKQVNAHTALWRIIREKQ